ncbi:hypothetical protein FGO68_gene8775 [Halteria grandinella]|uniref:Uncharacterized protein n=1 Tax=Halteria grandinella TaxID=5974 RepID=A0A8J8NAY2_HALGN|nr:hypothetical protein FGO68_gene8775 [Halteria grandinella]
MRKAVKSNPLTRSPLFCRSRQGWRRNSRQANDLQGVIACPLVLAFSRKFRQSPQSMMSCRSRLCAITSYRSSLVSDRQSPNSGYASQLALTSALSITSFVHCPVSKFSESITMRPSGSKKYVSPIFTRLVSPSNSRCVSTSRNRRPGETSIN